MGSRPPRRQPQTRRRRREARPKDVVPERATEPAPLGALIGIAAIPVAIGSSSIGYLASGSFVAVGIAVLLAAVVMGGIGLLMISKPAWRARLKSTNELVAGVLLGILGLAFTLGGIAAGAIAWIVVGVILLGGAFLLARPSLRASR